jgi:LysM repeat protein
VKAWGPLLAGLGFAALLGACAVRGSIRVTAVRPKPTLASLATPTPEASPMAPAPVTRTVTVKKGDSLWRIAHRELGQGLRYSQLAQENSLAAPYLILPGQVLSLLVSAQGFSGTTQVSKPLGSAANEARRYGWAKVQNRAFNVGEKLTFAVQYGSITAGYATMSIPEAVDQSGRPVYHIVAEAKTHPFFEHIFKVQDRIESYIDADYLFSWRYEKHLHEGGYQADAAYLFDQRAGRMREPAKGKDEAMPIGSQDVISCFYAFRTMDMTVGSEHSIRVSADDMKNYELKVNVLRKERVSTLAGDFDCVVVQPHLTFQGVFQQKGEVFIWLTDDERRIPVKVESKIAIGSININLQDADWVESTP